MIRHETNVKRFMAHYGTSTESGVVLCNFVDLQTTQNVTDQIAKRRLECSPLPFDLEDTFRLATILRRR